MGARRSTTRYNRQSAQFNWRLLELMAVLYVRLHMCLQYKAVRRRIHGTEQFDTMTVVRSSQPKQMPGNNQRAVPCQSTVKWNVTVQLVVMLFQVMLSSISNSDNVGDVFYGSLSPTLLQCVMDPQIHGKLSGPRIPSSDITVNSFHWSYLTQSSQHTSLNCVMSVYNSMMNEPKQLGK